MATVELTTTSYVRSVAVQAGFLLDGLTAGREPATAVRTLMTRADWGAENLEAEPDDEFGQAAVRLGVVSTLLAADQATGTGAAPAQRDVLAQSVGRLTGLQRELEDASRFDAAGFAPVVPPSATVGAAVAQLREWAHTTIDVVVGEIAGLFQCLLDSISRHTAKDALGAVGGEVKLADWAGELAALVKKLIEWVLRKLARWLPAGRLGGLRDKVDAVLGGDGSLRGTVEAVFGVAVMREEVDRCLAVPGLRIADLDEGTAEMMRLKHSYTRQMSWARLAVGAIAPLTVVGLVTTGLAAPSVLIVAPVLQLTVVCAATALSLGYLAGEHGLVHGVGFTVKTACGMHP